MCFELVSTMFTIELLRAPFYPIGAYPALGTVGDLSAPAHRVGVLG
jgi:hypothetical protein